MQITVSELRRAHAAEINRLADELGKIAAQSAQALALRDAQVEAARKQAGVHREEATQKQHELAEANADVKALSEQLAAARAGARAKSVADLRAAHAEELSRHADILSEYDAELDKARKKVLQVEMLRADEAAVWQRSLADAEGSLQAVREELAQERAGGAGSSHAEEEEVWRRMLTDAEKDLQDVRDALALERELTAKASAEGERVNAELRQAHIQIEDASFEIEELRLSEVTRVEAAASRERELLQAQADAERQRAEADEVWRQRLADELGQERNRRGTEHARLVSAREAEIDRMASQAQQERQEAHQRFAQVEAACQLRVAQAEEACQRSLEHAADRLAASEAECSRQREEHEEVRARAELHVAQLRQEQLRQQAEAEQVLEQREQAHVAALAQLNEILQQRERAHADATALQEQRWREEQRERELVEGASLTNAQEALEKEKQLTATLQGDLAATRVELERERELAAQARANHENAMARLQQLHADELVKLAHQHAEEQSRIGVRQAEVCAALEADLDSARRALKTEREEADRQLAEAGNAWRVRLVEAEADLKSAQEELTRERERASSEEAEGKRTLDALRHLHAEELAHRDRQKSDLLAKYDDDRRDWQRQAEESQHANEQATLQRAAAEETLRQSLAQVEGQLKTALEELVAEKQAVAKAHGVIQVQLADLKQAHATEIGRLRSDHAQALARKDEELTKAQKECQGDWVEAALQLQQSKRDLNDACERERQEGELAATAQAESERAAAEAHKLSSELTQQALWHAKAMERHGIEVDRLRRELQQGGNEANSLRARVEEVRQQGEEEARAHIQAAREQFRQEHVNVELRCQQVIESLNHAHASELSSSSMERRNEKITSELRELTARHNQLESHQAAAKEAWQRQLARASSDVETSRRELEASQRECWRERELVAKSECALSEVRRAHADELVRVAEDLGRESSERARTLADMDSEISRLKAQLKAGQAEAKEQLARSSSAWERRLAEAEHGHTASLEYAAKLQLDADLASKSLQECRHELASERKCVQDFHARADAQVASLEQAKSALAAAELEAEARRTEAIRSQVEHRTEKEQEARSTAAEVLLLQQKCEESQTELQMSERTWYGVVRGLEAQLAALGVRSGQD